MVSFKEIEINDLIEHLAQTIQKVQDSYILVSEKLGCDRLKDARTLYFHNLAETLQSYYFAVHFSKTFPKMGALRNIDAKDDKERAEIIKIVWSSYLDEMKSALFISFFVITETCIRVIVEHLVKEINPMAGFEKVIKKFLELAENKGEALSLFQILVYTRNTVHFSGIAKKATLTKSYKGVEYKFEIDKPVNFLDFEGILFLVNEAVAAMADILTADAIRKDSLISHPSSKVFCKKI